MMRFSSPRVLFILLALPLWVWSARRNRPAGSIVLPTLDAAADAGRSWRNRLSIVPFCLRILAVALLIFALARPQRGGGVVRDVNRGIAIEMVVDRSSSMADHISCKGSSLKRIDLVKQMIREFISGNGKELRGRTDDLVGVVSFARYAETLCPLTLSHDVLLDFMKRVDVAGRRQDGTAIGDALALAAARLKDADTSPAHSSSKSYSIKSKVIILLTDGHNNAGKRTPEQGAALARKWGVRIYALGIGGDRSSLEIKTPFGDRQVSNRNGIDRELLRGIASQTGGKFWLADSPGKIRRICSTLDRLEKSRVYAPRFSRYSEKFHPLVIAALMLIALEQILSLGVLRKIP